MITIYDPQESTFTHNGLGALWASSATVTEELNGLYELSLTCPDIPRNKNILPTLSEFYIIKAQPLAAPSCFASTTYPKP